MATESQFDLWRKDIVGGVRKAVEAGAVANGGKVAPHTRMQLAIDSAMITSNVMVAERLGQLVQILTTSGDERLAQMSERIRTGEQILSRIQETAEDSNLTLDDELMVSITMAEDWLNPGGVVGFATPESVERGTDPQSQEFADSDEEEPDVEVQDPEPEDDPFDRAEKDMRSEDER